MTVQVKQIIRKFDENIRKNSPRIDRKLSKAGVRVERAVIVSAAKYYDALNKLAKE
jgi:hypothetical protein